MAQPSIRIAIVGSSTVVESYHLAIVGGSLGADWPSVLEELTTPGVNGQRYSEVHRKADDLVVEVIEDVATSTGILDRESRYQQATAGLADVTVRIGDGVRRWDAMTVVDVQVLDRLGPLHGAGAKSGSRHTLRSRWTLRANTKGR